MQACLALDLSLDLPGRPGPLISGLIRSLSALAGVTPHSAAAKSDRRPGPAPTTTARMEGQPQWPWLAEDYQYVIGGDPDRDTIDLAVLDTATGRTRAHLAAPADGAGYGRMLDWASQHRGNDHLS